MKEDRIPLYFLKSSLGDSVTPRLRQIALTRGSQVYSIITWGTFKYPDAEIIRKTGKYQESEFLRFPRCEPALSTSLACLLEMKNLQNHPRLTESKSAFTMISKCLFGGRSNALFLKLGCTMGGPVEL